MAVRDRRIELCEQDTLALTGIDFIRVVDHQVQDLLWVFLIIDPTSLTPPLVGAGLLTPPTPGQEAGPPINASIDVSIASVDDGRSVEVVEPPRWRLVSTAAGVRPVLEVRVVEPGGFENHTLRIEHDQIDPFFNNVVFNFKQGCPSPFDCEHHPKCPDAEPADVVIDYLARDFDSYRQALLDFAAKRYPGWRDPLEADLAVMLMEIMAALGDEFAFLQDQYAREASISTASQRRSLSSLARLVDYEVDPGSPGTTELAVWVDAAVAPDGAQTAAGMQAWARVEGRLPITFTVTADEWHHPAWNEIPLHCADGEITCLPAGSTSAFLSTAAPTGAQVSGAGTTLTNDEFWIGRRAILRDVPTDPADPVRAWSVTITAIERETDELLLSNGTATPLTKISWDEGEATPFPLTLGSSSALLNVSTVIAGEAITEHFRVGTDADVLSRFPGLTDADQRSVLALPQAIEREGPYDPDTGARGNVVRYGLRASETVGVGWSGNRDPFGLGTASNQSPRLEVIEVEAPSLAPITGATAWSFRRDLLDGDLDSASYTVEEGMWRTTVTHKGPAGDFAFGDYASNDGWSLRFGDGFFGRSPEPGTIMAARYFSAPGAEANLGTDSIQQTTTPPELAESLPIPHAQSVTNPFAISDGTNEETAASVRIRAPQAYRSLPLRAVRPEDFSEILERQPFVQRANSVTRFTGSWSTDFVTADPRGGFQLGADQLASLANAVDCTRQAAREVCVTQPDYLDLDLEVAICVNAASYPGEVIPRVIEALESPGLLHPDNFTFGQPLRRSVVEATVQSVPGVLAVDEIRYRIRRQRDWQVFDHPAIAVAPSQIIRLQNDPDHPGRGSLAVRTRGSTT